MCLSQNVVQLDQSHWYYGLVSNEIDSKPIDGLRNYMLNMPDAKAEVVDASIETFEKLNRGIKYIDSLREHLKGIPGTSPQAVDELLKMLRADLFSAATPGALPTGIFKPKMLIGEHNLGDIHIVSKLKFKIKN